MSASAQVVASHEQCAHGDLAFAAGVDACGRCGASVRAEPASAAPAAVTPEEPAPLLAAAVAGLSDAELEPLLSPASEPERSPLFSPASELAPLPADDEMLSLLDSSDSDNAELPPIPPVEVDDAGLAMLDTPSDTEPQSTTMADEEILALLGTAPEAERMSPVDQAVLSLLDTDTNTERRPTLADEPLSQLLQPESATDPPTLSSLIAESSTQLPRPTVFSLQPQGLLEALTAASPGSRLAMLAAIPSSDGLGPAAGPSHSSAPASSPPKAPPSDPPQSPDSPSAPSSQHSSYAGNVFEAEVSPSYSSGPSEDLPATGSGSLSLSAGSSPSRPSRKPKMPRKGVAASTRAAKRKAEKKEKRQRRREVSMQKELHGHALPIVVKQEFIDPNDERGKSPGHAIEVIETGYTPSPPPEPVPKAVTPPPRPLRRPPPPTVEIQMNWGATERARDDMARDSSLLKRFFICHETEDLYPIIRGLEFKAFKRAEATIRTYPVDWCNHKGSVSKLLRMFDMIRSEQYLMLPYEEACERCVRLGWFCLVDEFRINQGCATCNNSQCETFHYGKWTLNKKGRPKTVKEEPVSKRSPRSSSRAIATGAAGRASSSLSAAPPETSSGSATTEARPATALAAPPVAPLPAPPMAPPAVRPAAPPAAPPNAPRVYPEWATVSGLEAIVAKFPPILTPAEKQMPPDIRHEILRNRINLMLVEQRKKRQQKQQEQQQQLQAQAAAGAAAAAQAVYGRPAWPPAVLPAAPLAGSFAGLLAAPPAAPPSASSAAPPSAPPTALPYAAPITAAAAYPTASPTPTAALAPSCPPSLPDQGAPSTTCGRTRSASTARKPSLSPAKRKKSTFKKQMPVTVGGIKQLVPRVRRSARNKAETGSWDRPFVLDSSPSPPGSPSSKRTRTQSSAASEQQLILIDDTPSPQAGPSTSTMPTTAPTPPVPVAERAENLTARLLLVPRAEGLVLLADLVPDQTAATVLNGFLCLLPYEYHARVLQSLIELRDGLEPWDKPAREYCDGLDRATPEDRLHILDSLVPESAQEVNLHSSRRKATHSLDKLLALLPITSQRAIVCALLAIFRGA